MNDKLTNVTIDMLTNKNESIFSKVDFDLKEKDDWIIGTAKDGKTVYTINAKVFAKGSETFGIDKGPVSKLWIKNNSTNEVIINYDRGWDIKPTFKTQKIYKETMKAVIDFRNSHLEENISLEEATVNALRNEEYLDKNIEDQLDNVYNGLIREIKKAFPDCKIEDKDLSDQGYKHKTTITTPSIMVKENVFRYILIDIFYDIPSFPVYSYYLGASAEVVESSSNETSVAGLKSNGYEIKNKIPNCKISIKAYAGEDIIDKGQSIDEFTSNVLKAYNILETYNIKRFV